MKGAQAHEVGAAFFELHVAAHDLDHVSAGDELLDECLGYGHGRYCGLEQCLVEILITQNNAFAPWVCATQPGRCLRQAAARDRLQAAG